MLLDVQLHGIPAKKKLPVSRNIPVITPEVVKQLQQEMQEIREEFSKRVRKMYDIPIEQIFAKSR